MATKSITVELPYIANLNRHLDLPNLDTAVIAASGDQTMDVRTPLTYSVIAKVPVSTPSDVEGAFAYARRAQKAWAARPIKERARVANRFARLVLENRNWLLDLLQLETGKARTAAFEEVVDLPMWASYVHRNASRALKPRRRSGALPALTQTQELRAPHGVVGIITPWNYPLTLPGTDSLPALVAGNAVVLKPDSLTPLTGIAVANLLLEAGVPEGVLQVVIGPGSIVGEALTDHADYVTFTGSTRTGKGIGAKCGGRLVGFAAELGGKNPLLVLEDADVERAAAGAAQACFANAGQLCISVERIYVTSKHWDAFKAAFVQNVRNLKLDAGFSWKADVGSLASQAQLDKVIAAVEDAKLRGATVLAGGRARPDLGPFFFEPTVLENVTENMDVFAKETFGPVVSLYQVEDDQAAIEAANDSDYGLNASVWSRRTGRRAAQKVQAGIVNVNDGYGAAWASYDAPMGGIKDSGVGRRHGLVGIQKYTQQQTIAQQRGLPVSGPKWVSHETWAKTLTVAAQIMRRLP